jgi:GntR family transcriptional regulator
MGLVISRKSGIPIYVQLKSQIKDLVQRGIWVTGHRLPTERELALQLGVSRNTVSMAYNELEAEGIISRRQGSGTYVSVGEDSLERAGRKERLIKMIDLAMEEASHIGFSIEDFTAIVMLQVRERKELLEQLQVAFIECNREQLDYFTRELELGSGVAIHPLLLDDLRAGTEGERNKLARMDLVVTTFYHLDEVRELGAPADKILGIALEPELASIVHIARIPRETVVPVVCLTQTFGASVVEALSNVGLTFNEAPIITSRNLKEVQRVLTGLKWVICSPSRKKDVEAVAKPGTQIIEFIFHPDAGSITALKTSLLTCKRKNTGSNLMKASSNK